jgi:outer membrane protein TolC
MKPALGCGWRLLFLAIGFGVFLCSFHSTAIAEPLPLKRVVELALRNSPTAAAATAEEQRAFAAYREQKDQYIPQVVVGSGLGQSWGYPLSLEGSAPSIFNISAQSALINPALRQFLHATRTDWNASNAQAKDQRNQVIQDTVLSYAELSKWQSLLGQLQQEQAQAQNAEKIEHERVQAGVDNLLLLKHSRLATARIRYRLAQAEGAIDLLRNRLSQLTGLPAASIDADPDSIPAIADKPDDVAADAVQASPAVQAANLRAQAEEFRAQAERKSLWPTLDFAAQYALLDTTLNNYQQFFQPGSFQRHNATIGVAIRFPFFSLVQHARADAAEAEAIRRKREAQDTRDKAAQEVLQLRHSVEQLAAAQQVANLEYEVAQGNLDAAQVKYNAGTGSLGDVQEARDQVNQRFDGLQDSNFELEKAQIMLLGSEGKLQDWMASGK